MNDEFPQDALDDFNREVRPAFARRVFLGEPPYVPHVGSCCLLAMPSFGGLNLVIDPEAPRDGPHAIGGGDGYWEALAEDYRRA